MFGSGDHLVVLALEASWAPGLFARDVQILKDSVEEQKRVSGGVNLGITLAYYVPFFDLN